MEINHYEVLGFKIESIGVEELTKLNSNEISKAYKSKALELHPDKRPNDPNANSEFQQLKISYDILIDVKLRKAFDTNLLMDVKLPKDFDTTLRSKHEEERRWQQRHKKMVDPDEKEKETDMARRWKERHMKTVDPDEEKEMDMARRWQQRHKKTVDPDENEKEKEMDMADFEAFKKGLERKMMTDVEKKKEWLRHKFEEEKESVLTQKRKLDEGEERRHKIMKAARDLVIQEEKDRQLRKMMSNIEKDEDRRRR